MISAILEEENMQRKGYGATLTERKLIQRIQTIETDQIHENIDY